MGGARFEVGESIRRGCTEVASSCPHEVMRAQEVEGIARGVAIVACGGVA